MTEPRAVGIDVRTVLLAVVAATLWVALVRPGPVSLPYFWDEADVYVPGAVWLAENGLDFRPGVFPDDWSRGHPPLLYFVSGAAFKLFGSSPTVGHLLVLPFAILALVATWLLGDELFGKPAGAAAALLLGTTPLFMSMANMLLPEMFLTGLTALALLFFARGWLVGAAAVGCALVLIKETGVFTPAALTGAVVLWAWRDGRLADRATWKMAAVQAIPVAVLCGFFAWQKLLAGYFVFPHHAGMLMDRAPDVWTVFPSLLAWHGRWIVVVAAVLAAAWAWRSNPPPSSDRLVPTALAIGLLAAANAVFFAKMFWLERYILPAHVGLVVLCAGVLLRLPRRLGMVPIAAAAVLGGLGIVSTPAPDEAELTFAYADVIETHLQAFDALPADAAVLTTWPMTEELRRPELGFVDAPVSVVHARHLEDSATPSITHVLVAARSVGADALREAASARGLKLLATVHHGRAPQALELYGP